MANIPIEKTGTPWWLWLLGGLLLLGALLAFLFINGDDEIAEVDPIEAVTPVVTDDALDLSDVYVTRVVGDNTFFVAPTEGGTDETLVYLEEEPTPNDPTEGRYDVTEGQNIAITGEMRPVGDTDLSAWGLTADQTDLVGDEYVEASRLTILDGPAAALGLGALTGDLSQYAGQMVDFDEVRVTALAGDSTFFVGDGDERTLVVLEDLGEAEDGPGDGTDGVFDVNVGDVVSIDGEVLAFQPGMRGTTTLADADRSAVEARRYVIVIDGRGQFAIQ